MKRLLFLSLAAMLFCMAGTNLSAGANVDTIWTKFLFNYGTCLATKFSPDGSKVAVGTEKGFIFVYDTETGDQLNSFKHKSSVLGMVFSNDGNRLYSINRDTLVEWDVNETDVSKQIKRKLWDTTKIDHLNYQVFTKISVSADGRSLFLHYEYEVFKQSAEEQDHFYNTWKVDLETFDIQYLQRKSANKTYGIKPTPDGTKLIVAQHSLDEEIFVRDANTYETIKILDNPFQDRINDIAVSPDSKLIAAAGEDGTVRIWSLDSMKLVGTFPTSPSRPASLTFISNDQLVVAYMYHIQKLSISAFSVIDSFFTATIVIKQPDFNFGLNESIHFSNNKISLSSDGGLMLLNNPFTDIVIPEEPIILLYPNPSNSTVTIDFEEIYTQPISITLNSLDGSINRILYSDILQTNSFTFSVAEYPTGVYFVRVQINDSFLTYKFIKE